MLYLLQQLLETSAKIYPDKKAILHKKNTMTYQDLNIISSQLANRLIEVGIKKGDRIGIYLNKSIPAIIAIFAILKAGAIYIPLDPTAPSQRITLIIKNAKVKALISTAEKIKTLKYRLSEIDSLRSLLFVDHLLQTDSRNLEKLEIPDLSEIESFNSIQVISCQDILKSSPSSPTISNLIENDLAYILYTSGSTGIPKGVMISHRAALTFINWSCHCFQVQPTDRVSHHAPLHFDLSIFDIFTTIKAGGTVILVPPELSVFPRNLAHFISQQQITIWYSVPSVLTQLVNRGNLQQHQFLSLRMILFAGEVFPVKYLGELINQFPKVEFYNLYGPTETNVCTYYPVKELPAEQIEPIPIGIACENTEVFAVNERDEIAQIGEVGELYVRSPSVMTGYWGMPDKSQEVLVPYAVHPELGKEIVYKTGDLVQQRSDGNFLYLGRRDTMLKSRGYRIEAGEIETAIYRHPAVLEVAVIPIPDEEMGNNIKAITVLKDGVQITESELKAFCSDILPKYMIPGLIEFRQSLPKTSTGKIDKTLLRQQNMI
ncbi:MAG: amino acid adenylation domain-containing protein [Microcoleaceae cyanobacterium]